MDTNHDVEVAGSWPTTRSSDSRSLRGDVLEVLVLDRVGLSAATGRSTIAAAMILSPVERENCAARCSGALPWRLELNQR